MLRLSDLIAVPALGLEVVHAAGALDRELRWVHVTELPDPGPYLRAGELVMTNGLWLRRRVSAEAWVAAVRAGGASAVVLGLLADRPAVPKSVRAACARHGLPLLALPVHVPFAAVTEEIAALHAGERQRELTRSLSRSDALAQALADGADEEQVLALLVRDHDLPVAVVSRAGEVLSARGLRHDELDAGSVAAALDGPRRVEAILPDGRAVAVFRVGALKDADAALVCLRPYVDLDRAERAALEQTARFLTVELARRQALQAVESRFAGEMVDMLHDPRRSSELPARLRSFAVDPDGPLAVLSAALGGSGARTASGGEAIVSRAFRGFGAAFVATQGADDILVVAAWPHGADRLDVAAADVAEALGVRWPERRATVGVGALADGHADLRRAVIQAREARRAGQRRRVPPRVAGYAEASSHRALMGRLDPEALLRFSEAVLEPVRRYDDAQAGQLEQTLRTFLAHGGRFGETASVLDVHVNTLRNRLARIEELTRRDLGATEDRVDLFLALHTEPEL